jgi:hypothetical protein
MIVKRATKRLKALGYPHLEIHKGLWGYHVEDNRFWKQTCPTTRKTPDEVIVDVLAGNVPVGLLREERNGNRKNAKATVGEDAPRGGQ